MTRAELIRMLESALASAKSGDDEILDRCLIELGEHKVEDINDANERRIMSEARKVPGGYHYSGVCSEQMCFYLRDGGELRFITCEADDEDGNPSDMRLHIDHYSGNLPPGITGPASKTGDAS